LYQQRGDLAKAEPLLTRALDIRSEALGPVHPDVAWTLMSLGTLEQSKQQPYKAIEYYNKALLIQRGTDDRRSQAQTLNHLGQVYEAVGDKNKALNAFAESRQLAPDQNEPPLTQVPSVKVGSASSVLITYPSENGASVAANLTVRGVASLQSGEYLWVLARPSNSERWRPIGQAKVDPGTNGWEMNVRFWGSMDVGPQFDIAAIIVKGAAHDALTNALGLDGDSMGRPTLIPLPPVVASSFVVKLRTTGF
jgi:tetratricopeptide (TPR) repeat protein